MPDFLQRDQAPLGPGEWAAVDQTVVRTAQSVLVGRRFISLVGPFGAGVQALPVDILTGGGDGQVDLLGDDAGRIVGIQSRRLLALPLLYKDFWLHWRDIESSRQLGVPLDVGITAAAASAVALSEDRMIVHGNGELGLYGLINVEGRQTLPMSDWDSMGRAFADVVEGVRVLTQGGFTGPYALVVSPRLYADLNRIFDNSGVLELEQIEKLARRGVYPTAVLPERTAVLVDSGAANMDLAVGVDTSTAYVESDNLNHRFRVVESLVLRIRRPGAICTFEATTSGGGRAGQTGRA